jgi:hypothetical protein
MKHPNCIAYAMQHCFAPRNAVATRGRCRRSHARLRRPVRVMGVEQLTWRESLRDIDLSGRQSTQAVPHGDGGAAGNTRRSQASSTTHADDCAYSTSGPEGAQPPGAEEDGTNPAQPRLRPVSKPLIKESSEMGGGSTQGL